MKVVQWGQRAGAAMGVIHAGLERNKTKLRSAAGAAMGVIQAGLERNKTKLRSAERLAIGACGKLTSNAAIHFHIRAMLP